MVCLLACPQRCSVEQSQPIFYPFGNTPARNILKGFEGSEPVEDDGTGLNVNNKYLIIILKLTINL